MNIYENTDNDKSVYYTTTKPLEYIRKIVKDTIPKQLHIFFIKLTQISPTLLTSGTHEANWITTLNTKLNAIPQRIRTYTQNMLLNVLDLTNMDITGAILDMPVSSTPYYVDDTTSITDSSQIISSNYWKNNLLDGVIVKKLNSNTPIKNIKIIRQECPHCINYDSPLGYLKMPIDTEGKIGDLVIYNDTSPYVLQTLYSGLSEFIKTNTTCKYILGFLHPEQFLLYDLYVNILGFSDVGIPLDLDFHCVCIETDRLKKILKNMLSLIPTKTTKITKKTRKVNTKTLKAK